MPFDVFIPPFKPSFPHTTCFFYRIPFLHRSSYCLLGIPILPQYIAIPHLYSFTTYYVHLIVARDVWEPVWVKTISFDLLFEVNLPCSVWHSAHGTLEIKCIYCNGRMWNGSAVALSSLNLWSGDFNWFLCDFQKGLKFDIKYWI